jgi:hypothetical protein
MMKAKLGAFLHPETDKAKLWTFDTLPSTNDEAKRRALEGAPSGTVILAEEQTGGRGRRGRTWESPEGKNLYFSLLLRPDIPLEKASMLTLLMAVSVTRAIEEIGGKSAGIKWPNDILIHGKKVDLFISQIIKPDIFVTGVKSSQCLQCNIVVISKDNGMMTLFYREIIDADIDHGLNDLILALTEPFKDRIPGIIHLVQTCLAKDRPNHPDVFGLVYFIDTETLDASA